MPQSITSFDLSILLWIQEHMRNDICTPIMKFISFLGNNGWFLIVLTLIFLIVRRTRILGAASVISLAIQAVLVNLIIKKAVARPRPYFQSMDLVPLMRRLNDHSFPSGHTSASVCLAVACYGMGYTKLGHILSVFSLLMAYSRLYVGFHFPTDVLGGAVIGAVSAIAAVAITRRFIQKKA